MEMRISGSNIYKQISKNIETINPKDVKVSRPAVKIVLKQRKKKLIKNNKSRISIQKSDDIDCKIDEVT
jgi:hypothetical protein